jgi:hypothetical protein
MTFGTAEVDGLARELQPRGAERVRNYFIDPERGLAEKRAI